jgi:DNA repair ATPase RecN
MDITELAEYKNKYLRIYSAVQEYLTESPQDEQWKLNERYYGEYIRQVEALYTQIRKLSTTMLSKQEAVKTIEEILMKIDFNEKALKFVVQRNQVLWQREKKYLEYLQNLAVLEQYGRQSTQKLEDIHTYEMNNTQRVAFKNGSLGYGI